MKKRPIRIEGDVAYVPLTKGYTAIIDAADAHLVEGANWYANVQSHTVYAARNVYSNGSSHAVLVHRVIMDAPADLKVDHINGDALDNRRSNLRLATHAQNLHNQRLSTRNTCGFKGVWWDNLRGKWKAGIRLGGKHHHLGYHRTAEAAHAAYTKASAELHGEFGRVA